MPINNKYKAPLATSTKYPLNGAALRHGKAGYKKPRDTSTLIPDAIGFNNQDGEVTFAPLEFDQPGIYTYTMKELGFAYDESDIDPRWQLDTTEHTVVIEVQDTGYGSLKAEVINCDKPIVFENKFTSPSNVKFKVKVAANKEMKPGEFKFKIVSDTGDIVATGTNVKGGLISDVAFTDLALPQLATRAMPLGVHELSIIQENLHEDGWTYDKSVGKFYILVKLDANGKAVYVPCDKNGVELSEDYTVTKTFFNNYGGLMAVTAKKVIVNGETHARIGYVNAANDDSDGSSDSENTLNGKFRFALFTYDEETGKYDQLPDTLASEDDRGVIRFPEKYIQEATEFTMYMHELAPDTRDEEMIYDRNYYPVTVSAIDSHGDGIVDGITLVYPEGNTFTNTIGKDVVNVTIYAKKEAVGADLEGGDFNFELYSVEGGESEIVPPPTQPIQPLGKHRPQSARAQAAQDKAADQRTANSTSSVQKTAPYKSANVKPSRVAYKPNAAMPCTQARRQDAQIERPDARPISTPLVTLHGRPLSKALDGASNGASAPANNNAADGACKPAQKTPCRSINADAYHTPNR